MMTATRYTYQRLLRESHDNRLLQLYSNYDCQSVPWTDIELNIININMQNRLRHPACSRFSTLQREKYCHE